jgi:L-lactate dehydrogenase complex protein LldE
MLVDIFIPCYIDQMYPQTGINMVKLLEKADCKVNYNTEQTCCGQVAFNAGFWDECKEVGEKFINEFQADRYIVSPSSSCVGMVKNHYPELFFNTALHNENKQIQRNMYEFTQFVVSILKHTQFGASLNAKAVFMDTCCSLRECKAVTEPRQLLANVIGLELFELKNPQTCCGFGGIFSVKNEAISVAMAKEKIEDVLSTGAEIIISTDTSCLMHLQGYITKNNIPLKTMHICDVLASGW